MNDLQKREKDLLRQLEQARQEYDTSARAAASGDPAANQATIRKRIATFEGELADVRAAIQGGERIDNERQADAARKHRVRLLNDAVKQIVRRSELPSEMIELIDQLGKAYTEFTQTAIDARNSALRGDRSKRTFEAVDLALGMRENSDQLLAGLLHIAGLGPVMEESGQMWASDIRAGRSLTDITFSRTTRALTAVRYQIDQENSNAPTPLSSRRSA